MLFFKKGDILHTTFIVTYSLYDFETVNWLINNEVYIYNNYL